MLTPDEAIGYDADDPARTGEVYISREGMHDPEPVLESFDGNVGPDEYNFDEAAADALLAANGYRRTGEWWAGSMNGRRPSDSSSPGHSCGVQKITPET